MVSEGGTNVDRLSENDIELIGRCAEENAGEDCGFVLGNLCEYCSVWRDKNKCEFK